jgi:hypothetical protein
MANEDCRTQVEFVAAILEQDVKGQKILSTGDGTVKVSRLWQTLCCRPTSEEIGGKLYKKAS